MESAHMHTGYFPIILQFRGLSNCDSLQLKIVVSALKTWQLMFSLLNLYFFVAQGLLKVEVDR